MHFYKNKLVLSWKLFYSFLAKNEENEKRIKRICKRIKDILENCIFRIECKNSIHLWFFTWKIQDVSNSYVIILLLNMNNFSINRFHILIRKSIIIITITIFQNQFGPHSFSRNSSEYGRLTYKLLNLICHGGLAQTLGTGAWVFRTLQLFQMRVRTITVVPQEQTRVCISAGWQHVTCA